MRFIARLFVATAIMASASPAWAADPTAAVLGLRLDKVEKEMHAVQRVVFPQGVPVLPEIGANPATVTALGAPAQGSVADLTARVDSLEKTLTQLTGQVETNANRLRQQEDILKRLEARIATVEGGATTGNTAPTATGAISAPVTSGTPLASTAARSPTIGTAASKPAKTVGAARPTTTSPASGSKVDADRKTRVAAVEVPDTGDTAEDAYTYGFRLYTAKFYPEAETKLKEFVVKYSSHRRTSYAQNLLGRAYLDEGKPALAAVALYDNYQKWPHGDRAPESLYWLGQALTRLKKLPDACRAYNELSEVFGTKLTVDMKAKVKKGRVDAKCSA